MADDPIEPDDEREEGEEEEDGELVESWETDDETVTYELRRTIDVDQPSGMGYELLVFSEQFEDAPPGDGGVEGEKDGLSFCIATTPKEIDEIISILAEAKKLMI